MSGCESVSDLPAGFWGLELVELKLRGCTSLRQLPEALGGLSSLRDLNLTANVYIVALPKSIQDLSLLESLSLQFCRFLDSTAALLPENFTGMQSLRVIDMRGCVTADNLREVSKALKSTLVLTNICRYKAGEEM